MPSSMDFTWSKPLAITPEFLQRIEDVVKEFSAGEVERQVQAAGLNSKEFVSSHQIKDRYEQTKDIELYSLSKAVEGIEKINWSLTTYEDARRTHLRLPDVLGMTNSGTGSLKSVEISCNYLYSGLTISLGSKLYGKSASVEISGEYARFSYFRGVIEELFHSQTQSWWMMTLGWVGTTIYFASYVVFTLTFAIIAILIANAAGADKDTATTIGSIIFTISLVLLGVLGYQCTKIWARIFPLAEFQFGGGARASEQRKTWRKILWVTPILVIGFPVFTNWLSSAIFG